MGRMEIICKMWKMFAFLMLTFSTGWSENNVSNNSYKLIKKLSTNLPEADNIDNTLK